MDNYITIAIPTHKRPSLLIRALDSVISKDHVFEILVSINGKDEHYDEYKKIKENIVPLKI